MSVTRILCNFCGLPQVYCKCGTGVKTFQLPTHDDTPFTSPNGSFQADLEKLINRHSLEGGSNTPDFILACFLRQCLEAFDMATRRRDEHREQ